jgi:hypothetical protein
MIKIVCFDGRPHADGKHFKNCDMYYPVQSVLKSLKNLCYCKESDGSFFGRNENEQLCAFCYFTKYYLEKPK